MITRIFNNVLVLGLAKHAVEQVFPPIEVACETSHSIFSMEELATVHPYLGLYAGDPERPQTVVLFNTNTEYPELVKAMWNVLSIVDEMGMPLVCCNIELRFGEYKAYESLTKSAVCPFSTASVKYCGTSVKLNMTSTARLEFEPLDAMAIECAFKATEGIRNDEVIFKIQHYHA